MSLCPICGRESCDHSCDERGQTFDEMMRPLSTEEMNIWKNESIQTAIEYANSEQRRNDDNRSGSNQ